MALLGSATYYIGPVVMYVIRFYSINPIRVET